MKCPKCNKVYSEENVYCVDCGTRLIDDGIDIKQGTPIERFSTRVKTSKPKSEPQSNESPQLKEVKDDDKLEILILQNRELIKQNNRIIELLEKLAD
jgi:transcription initiation factor TFIIIB Brf1 subunit/transcription initiation factor TFIIB